MSPGTAGRGMGARDAFPRLPEQAGATIPSFPQRSQVGWGQPHSQPCLGAVAARQSHPAQAAAAALHPGAAKGCSDTSSQQPGLRWGQRALSLPAWHSSQDSRGTGSSRCAWKHRHRHTPGPGMSTGPRACRALPQPLCPARAQAGWGGCARLGQLRVPTAPVPLLAPKGTPSTHLSRSSRRPSPGLASGPARGCPAPP